MVFRGSDHAIHVLTLISNSSARPSATDGDPRLPNLKRRLPEEKKTAQKAGVATVRIKMVCIRAVRLTHSGQV